MRILILSDRIPPENRGGAGRVVWNLACGLRDSGHEVHVVSATSGAPFEQIRDGIPTYHLHSRYPQRFIAYFALYNPQTIGHIRRLYERVRPDVVNAHNVHIDLSYYSLTSARQMGIPTVFNSHDVMPFAYNRLRHFVNPSRPGVESPEDYRLPRFYNLREMRFRYNPFRNLVIRRILNRHANARVAVSQAHRQSLEANGLPPFRVVYNGLDPETFRASAETVESLRQRLGLQGRRVILFAGRLTRDKGSHQILRAMNLLVQQMPEALLLVLSSRDFPQENLNQPEFAALHANHVRSAGWLEGDELTTAYHLADVVTVPSVIMDSFPTVNLEAMAAGKPLISTCFGGSPEIVVDGETGFVVNPFDTETYAEKLALLLRDDSLRQRMSQAGYHRLATKFTLAEQIRQMVGIYEAVL